MKKTKQKSKKTTTLSVAASMPAPLRDLCDNLAENMRRLRAELDVSQAGLAARAGLSVGMVSQLEQCVRVPSLATISALAGALACYDRPWTLLLPPPGQKKPQ